MSSKLPKNYAYLERLAAPKFIVAAVDLFGTKEVPGKKSNPVILKWAKTTGLEDTYTNDGIAWCGLFIAYLCHLADRAVPINPLWALNWRFWGIPVDKGDERIGDVMVWERRNAKGKLIGGHIGLPIAQDKTHWHVLGGNQSDQIMIVRIPKDRKYWCRRPVYAIGMPAESKVLPWVNSEGAPASGKEV